MLIAALAAVIGRRVAGGVEVSRAAMKRALLAVFWAGFVVAPLWSIPRSAWQRLLVLAATAALGIVWARSAAAIRLRPARHVGTWAPGLVCLVVLAWHGTGLFAPLEFRGDESFHVARPLRVLESLTNAAASEVLPFLSLAVALLLLAAGRAPRRLAYWGFVGVVPLCLLGLFLRQPLEPELLARLARYPLLGAWLQLVAAFSPLDTLAGFRSALYDEALYRLVPFASALALGLLVLRTLKGPRWLAAGAAILVATAPTVGYFATSLYPDLTAVVIVSAGLLGIDAALRRALDGRSESSGAVALLAIGLSIKETLLPTGLAVAALAVVRGASRRRLPRAIVFAFALLAPIGTYLLFRDAAQRLLQGGRVFRGVSFDLSAFANPALVTILLRALVEQLGPLLPLAALGLLLTLRNSRTRLLVLVAGSQLLLFAMDTVVDTAWGRLPLLWSHARFLLTLLPVVLCFTIEALAWLGRRQRAVAAAAVAIGIAWNAWARPVALDGARRPFWGDYVAETSGERYPYDALYEWLGRAHEQRPLTIVGRDYEYRDDFYAKKHRLDISVIAPSATIARSSLVLAGGPDRSALFDAHVALLREAASAPGPVVLHVSAWLDADELPRSVGPLRVVRSLRLGRHVLLLYDR